MLTLPGELEYFIIVDDVKNVTDRAYYFSILAFT